MRRARSSVPGGPGRKPTKSRLYAATSGDAGVSPQIATAAGLLTEWRPSGASANVSPTGRCAITAASRRSFASTAARAASASARAARSAARSRSRSASACFRSWMSTEPPNQRTISAVSGSRYGSARTRNQRYSPAAERMRCSTSKTPPVRRASSKRAIVTAPSSGCTAVAATSAAVVGSKGGPV